MSNEDKKEKDKQRREPRTGSVVPEDGDLATWLHRLWARDEPPSRVEVWQMFGQNKSIRGEMVHHEDFKPNDKLDVERATRLANEIMAAVQNDCDAVERRQHYQICIIDKFRKSAPLVRRLGPISPKRGYLMKSGEAADEDDDEDGALITGRSLSLLYAKESNRQARWDKQRYDGVMGDLLGLYRDTVLQMRDWIDGMMKRQMDFFAQLQDAKDREADRAVARKLAEFKVTLLEEGLRTTRNLLPGLFGSDSSNGGGGHKRAANGTGVSDYGHSNERVLVDNLLTDCEKTGVSIALFGDWEVRDGRITPIADKPGIFSPAQFAVLIGVQSGRLPPEALDVLLPNSGDPKAITEDQIRRAQPLMSEGTGLALLELVGLRQRRHAAAATAAAAPPIDNINAER